MINYREDPEIKADVLSIIKKLNMSHIDPERVICIRSHGTKSRRVVARCHVLPRIMQEALKTKPHYVIEVVSERFDKLSKEEKIKTLIHELLHIPKSFGGGFRHHNYVNGKTVESLYKKLKGE
jgi:predicted metallopeptidase